HSGQDHRRVEKGVQPGKPRAKVVSEYPEAEGNPDDAEGERQAAQHPEHENLSGQKRFGSMFKHCGGSQSEAAMRTRRTPLSDAFPAATTFVWRHGPGARRPARSVSMIQKLFTVGLHPI